MALSYFSTASHAAAAAAASEADRTHAKYRRKYRDIKRRLSTLVIENAALCDEVAKVQESIVIVKEERRFLMRKVLEYDNDPEPYHRSTKSTSPSVHITNGTHSRNKKRRSDEH